MSKTAETALIAVAVVALSLLAAWLFGGSESRPLPERIAAPQVAPVLPAPVSVSPLTAPKPPPPPDPHARDTTDRGLAWLAKEQHPEGHWDLSTHRTGLALLAFLAAGETHKHGKHRRTVRNGLKVLKQIQHPDGIYKLPESPGSSRDHAIATLAMVEAYALTASPLFKQSAQQAVEAIPPRGELEKLASRWAGLALSSAKAAGLRVRPGAGAQVDFSEFGYWQPSSTQDPMSQYFGSGYAALSGSELGDSWRWELRRIATGLQQADGSFAPAGPYREYLGRVGTTALMTAATAATFWSERARTR